MSLAPETPFDASLPCVLFHARGRMIESECAFYTGLRRACRARGLELRLIAHHEAKAPMDAPLTRAPNGLDHPDAQAHEGTPGGGEPGSIADDDALLARERVWLGPERDHAHVERRRRALAHLDAFYRDELARTRPALTIIWNGRHAQEMLLAGLCAASGCPVLYCERGPTPGTLQFDEHGVLAATGAARRRSWSWPDERARELWLGVLNGLMSADPAGGTTWWAQPEAVGPDELRQTLGVRQGDTVLLFAGQVDADVQNLLYAPDDPTNLAAFERFLDALPRDRDDLFVLGKHHPKSDTPAEAYREAIARSAAASRGSPARWRAVWAENAALADALAVADRVAAVNSTVLFEACAAGKPALMLGRSLLTGKGIAHEPCDRADLRDAVRAWLAGEDADERHERWRDFAAWLLAYELIAMEPGLTGRGLRGVDALAERLAETVARSRAA